MSFASFVTKLSDSINSGIRAVSNSGIIPNVVGKTTRLGLNVGKAAGNAGFKVGMFGINSVLSGANSIIDNKDDIMKGFKVFGNAAAEEAGTFTKAVGGFADYVDRHLLKPAPFSDSLVGRTFNKKGVALVGGISLAMGTGSATKEYLNDRQGYNDGQLYRPTPMQATPYQLSEQMAYSSHGRSFAQNAGATGDLVFALNDMRHG